MTQAALPADAQAGDHIKPWIRGALRHLLYPVLALATLGYLGLELSLPRPQLGRYYGAFVAAMVVVLVLIEAAWPMRRAWRMTARTFWRRDLPFLLLGAATLGLADWAATRIVTAHALAHGRLLAGMPLLPGVVATILISDLLWYWVHRWSHEARGPVGRWLWRLHMPHHLPGQVYVLMHAIAHPLAALMVRAILVLPAFFLGFSPEVVFVASVVTGFQGLVSHFNVDSRVGWLNHLLVGTELHRYHHSATAAEAQNYGAVTSLWDQLFGTFVYRPGHAPAQLGLDEPARYPADTDPWGVLRYAWVRPGSATQAS